MRDIEAAFEAIYATCIKILVLLVLVAGYIVPLDHHEQRRFVNEQREWLEKVVEVKGGKR